MTTARQRVQADILRRRGLEKAGQGKLKPAQPESIRLPEGDDKTLVMKLIEQRLGLPMEVLLLDGKEVDIAKRLGVTESCISKWRLRLGMR